MPVSKPPRKKRRRPAVPIPRTSSVYFTVVSDADGTIQLTNDGNGQIGSKAATLGTVRSVTEYERASGKPKVLFSYSNGGLEGFAHQETQLRASLDRLIALDTNTRLVAGRRVSVSWVCASTTHIGEKPNEIDFNDRACVVVLDVRSALNPEMFALHLLLTLLLPSLAIPDGSRIGIVMDSELGRHPAMNMKSEPYYQQHFLPPNVHLVYASADAGDGTCNQAIRICDRKAGSVFETLKQNPSLLAGAVEACVDHDGFIFELFNC